MTPLSYNYTAKILEMMASMHRAQEVDIILSQEDWITWNNCVKYCQIVTISIIAIIIIFTNNCKRIKVVSIIACKLILRILWTRKKLTLHASTSIIHYIMVTLYTPDTPTASGSWEGGIADATVPAGAGTVGRVISPTSPMTTIILRPSEHCPPEFIDALTASWIRPFE